MSNKLEQARKIINEVDAEMARLFVRRMKAAELVAEYKMQHGLEIFDKEREDEVVKHNSLLVEDGELRPFYVNFIKDTMAISRSYQDKLMSGMRVAYSGTVGAFAHIAAQKLFPTARKIAYGSFEEAYRAALDGECDVCVLPTENSSGGEVGQVTDLMFSGSLYINGMYELAVSHDLVGVKGAKPEDIKTVISHSQALAQCREYTATHGFDCMEYANTALAAKHVADLCDKAVAAIASGEAAELFGLCVIEKNINESRSNTTRFAVFSRSENRHVRDDMGVHTVLLFTVRNEAGALARAIDIIGKHGFNMRSLRSRPMKELLWQYYFYVEAEGNIHTEAGRLMTEELAKYCDRLKIVGTYTKS